MKLSLVVLIVTLALAAVTAQVQIAGRRSYHLLLSFVIKELFSLTLLESPLVYCMPSMQIALNELQFIVALVYPSYTLFKKYTIFLYVMIHWGLFQYSNKMQQGQFFYMRELSDNDSKTLAV